ncbi:MAG: L-aspartate oxidase [Cryomorphaceae bacterium]|nr:L-aspartate oxidase [Cryomorphaceae bacterium]
MDSCDLIIIGAGVAGLSAALEAVRVCPKCEVVVLSKSDFSMSNSHFAQGGIAAVFDRVNDSIEKHFNDTLLAGGGLGNPAMIETLVMQAPNRILDLIANGVDFDTESDGALALGLEGGHSANRIVHQKDHTGKSLIDNLLHRAKQHPRIQLLKNQHGLRLIKDAQGNCAGIWVWNGKEVKGYTAKSVLLATGGCGQLFRFTTNPAVATGDGLAMASYMGASISGLAYMQFHPTALYAKNENPLFLISEAVRGAGAYLVNHHGERFVFKLDDRGELATRDVVSKAITGELKTSAYPYVFLDARHFKHGFFKSSFPLIYSKLKQRRIDPETDLIPVCPAAHYLCGGIDVDKYGRTNVPGLFALGECANSGLQGKNRLASNALSEALVFAKYVAEEMCVFANERVQKPDLILGDKPSVSNEKSSVSSYKKELLYKATDCLSYEDNHFLLQKAGVDLQELYKAFSSKKCVSIQDWIFRDLVWVANLMCMQRFIMPNEK